MTIDKRFDEMRLRNQKVVFYTTVDTVQVHCERGFENGCQPVPVVPAFNLASQDNGGNAYTMAVILKRAIVYNKMKICIRIPSSDSEERFRNCIFRTHSRSIFQNIVITCICMES